MHVFISYSRRDGGVHAEWLEAKLAIVGFETWRDQRGITPTRDFTAEIETNIQRASHIVVCVTRDSGRQDSFVRREIQYALFLDKPVIPVRFENIAPPISIINNEWVDVFSGRSSAIERLCTILNGPRPANRRSPSIDDAFRPYVQRLYERMVKYLDRAVIREIELGSKSDPHAVRGRVSRREMFDLMFSPHHTENDAPDAPKIFGSFGEAFEYYGGRVLLLGEPGAGKTVTLVAYARDAAAARLDDPAKSLPIFGLVTAWKAGDDGKHPPMADWLATSYEDLKAEDIRRVLEDGRAVLLLDGLDELADKHEDFLRLLPVTNHIVMTSRLGFYHSLGEKVALNGAIVLQPMTDAQINDYLKDQPELLKFVRTDERLREIVRTPLLLSLFAFTYKHISAAERAQLSQLESARDLRDRLFLSYLERRYRYEERRSGENPLPFPLEQMYNDLGCLASWAVNLGRPNLAFADFEEAVGKDRSRQFVEFALLLNVIVPREIDGSPQSEYQFIHLLLRDALAFQYCIQNIRRYYTAHAHDDYWYGFGWDYYKFNSVDVLGKLNDPRAIGPIIQLLRDKDSTLRGFACQVLGEMRAYAAVDSLIAILPDGVSNVDYDLEYLIITALGDIGGPKAESVLKKALDSESKSVREAASRALIETGENVSRIGPRKGPRQD
jgi:hypothetical protein